MAKNNKYKEDPRIGEPMRSLPINYLEDGKSKEDYCHHVQQPTGIRALVLHRDHDLKSNDRY